MLGYASRLQLSATSKGGRLILISPLPQMLTKISQRQTCKQMITGLWLSSETELCLGSWRMQQRKSSLLPGEILARALGEAIFES